MTVKEFIAELSKYPNQNAEINFITNLVNADDEVYDVENCEVECFQQDVDNVDSYDIMIHRKKDNTDSIHELLSKHDKLSILLDKNDHYGNIVILDEAENVLREISVGGRHQQHENISVILSNIL